MSINVAVLGAGAAGLAAARRLKQDPKFRFQVFEQSGQLGGTWVFDERVGKDEYGLPIHTSMYRNLRTNLPKEVMGYPDYPILRPADKSYIAATDILKYLNDFADDHDIRAHIKFRHHVKRIEPAREGEAGWNVTVKDLISEVTQVWIFDAVMVCNGHYNWPNIPQIQGDKTFRGKKIHSHDYRTPQEYEGLVVVIIGAGPSGLDIGLEISSKARHVYISHHWPEPIHTIFPDNLTLKGDLLKIAETGVIFKDGTCAQVDCILYSTGYLYRFPFLAEECGVLVDNNHVFPLYKHFISIENPTLALMGLPFYICANSMFDIQVRFFMKLLSGEIKQPSKENMLEDERKEMDHRKAMGFSQKDYHKMGPLQISYFDDLASLGEIEGIAHVLTKLHNESSRRFLEDLRNFRNDRYQIVDQESFQLLE